MAIKSSTGLRNGMLVIDSFKGLMDGSHLLIYAGTEPATADAAISGATLLCIVSDDATGTGLTFAATASAGVLTKTVSQIWRGVNVATGTAAFFRIQGQSDDGSASTTNPRIQGNIALAGGDINLSSLSLVSAASQSIDNYTVALPTL
jgi:hypothetical protein